MVNAVVLEGWLDGEPTYRVRNHGKEFALATLSYYTGTKGKEKKHKTTLYFEDSYSSNALKCLRGMNVHAGSFVLVTGALHDPAPDKIEKDDIARLCAELDAAKGDADIVAKKTGLNRGAVLRIAVERNSTRPIWLKKREALIMVSTISFSTGANLHKEEGERADAANADGPDGGADVAHNNTSNPENQTAKPSNSSTNSAEDFKTITAVDVEDLPF